MTTVRGKKNSTLLGLSLNILVRGFQLVNPRFEAKRVNNRDHCEDEAINEDEAKDGQFAVFLQVFIKTLLTDELLLILVVEFCITADVRLRLADFD